MLDYKAVVIKDWDGQPETFLDRDDAIDAAVKWSAFHQKEARVFMLIGKTNPNGAEFVVTPQDEIQ